MLIRNANRPRSSNNSDCQLRVIDQNVTSSLIKRSSKRHQSADSQSRRDSTLVRFTKIDLGNHLELQFLEPIHSHTNTNSSAVNSPTDSLIINRKSKKNSSSIFRYFQNYMFDDAMKHKSSLLHNKLKRNSSTPNLSGYKFSSDSSAATRLSSFDNPRHESVSRTFSFDHKFTNLNFIQKV